MERYNRNPRIIKTEVRPKLQSFLSAWRDLKDVVQMRYRAMEPFRRRTVDLKTQLKKILASFTEDEQNHDEEEDDDEEEEDDEDDDEEDDEDDEEDDDEDDDEEDDDDDEEDAEDRLASILGY